MNLAIEKDKHPCCTFFIVLFSLAYAFLFHLNYPFAPTLFLYGAFFSFVMLIIITSKITINYNLLLFSLIAMLTSIGALYTTLPSEGKREAIIFVILAVMSIAMLNNKAMIKTLVKYIYILSILVTITVIVQFIEPKTFISIMQKILRSDSFELLMRSYQVDNAYAGISAYTSYTAYFAATVFGHSLINLQIRKGERLLFKGKTTNIILLIVALTATVLSSKRSLFLACLLAMIIVYAFINRNNFTFVLKLIVGTTIAVLLAYILYNTSGVFAEFMDRFGGDDITTGRDDIYASAWNSFVAEKNVFFGNGTGSAYKVFDTGLHNIYLQILYNHGCVGFIIFMSLFIYNYVIAIKSKCLISIFMQSIFLIYGLSGNPLYSFSHMFIYIVYSQYSNVYKLINDSERQES